MSEITELSEEDRELMAKYNIRAETKTAFFAEGYKYDNLSDAVRYARLSEERERDSGEK